MALRVLLADSSETIKKVIELALKDRELDLRVVTLGVDVIDVAQSFSPELILIDILLQKKNGYEVAIELRKHDDLKSVPLVLMWSAFMELDEEKCKHISPDGRLEKPFDSTTLIELVDRLAPPKQKTTTQEIEEKLESFDKSEITDLNESQEPENYDEDISLDLDIDSKENLSSESGRSISNLADANIPDIEDSDEDSDSQWNMESFDDLSSFGSEVKEEPNLDTFNDELEDSFQQVSLNHLKSSHKNNDEDITLSTVSEPPFSDSETPVEDDWIQKSINDFKLNIADDENGENFELLEPIKNEKINDPSFSTLKPLKELEPTNSHRRSTRTRGIRGDQDPEDFSEDRVKQLIEKQTKEVIERVAWEIVPDMASKIIREEIQRLMKELEGQ